MDAIFRSPKLRAYVIQAVGVTLFVAAIVSGGVTAWARLKAQGVAYGFGILFHPTGWTINSPFLAQEAGDPYWWTIVVALVDTAVVGLLAIIFSTVAGFLIGLGRLSKNKVIGLICSLYVGVFRNIPLVLQAVFWYVTFTSLPTPRADPPSFFGLAFLTNKGFYLPAIAPASSSGRWLLILLGVTVVLAVLPASRLWFGARLPQSRRPAFAVVVIAALVVFVLIAGNPVTISVPTLHGFSFDSGTVIPLEIIALTYAIVIFSSAYIAEIVRGGLLSVPAGQIEAALSVGLRDWAIFLKVRLPIALRSMIPPLSNQYIFIIKATALGIAVGYSDLFSVSVVSISQTGQAVEFLLVMMTAYVLLNYSTTLLMGWLNRAIAFKKAVR